MQWPPFQCRFLSRPGPLFNARHHWRSHSAQRIYTLLRATPWALRRPSGQNVSVKLAPLPGEEARVFVRASMGFADQAELADSGSYAMASIPIARFWLRRESVCDTWICGSHTKHGMEFRCFADSCCPHVRRSHVARDNRKLDLLHTKQREPPPSRAEISPTFPAAPARAHSACLGLTRRTFSENPS